MKPSQEDRPARLRQPAPGQARGRPPGPGQAEFASALLDPEQPCPGGLRAWNGSDPARRFAVHRNNVVGSLIDALADNFPVVQQLVGTEFFRAMAGLYVRRAPPRSCVLAGYGTDFPAFIDAFEPARGLPYLADMARLEAARVRAYHAADAEPASAASIAAVAAALAQGEPVGALRFACHPSLQALASRHAVVTLWAAHQDGAFEPIEIDRPECALVLRAGLEVLVLPAPAGSTAFVAALQAGSGLGAAADAARAARVDAAAQGRADETAQGPAPAFDLAAALALLLGHGAITAIQGLRSLDA
ncbi:MAG: putative DNA-binding domain-containing protein [Burkholderiales bacterium]|nr:putative DNA-binding domain-containing protein [Burkholderiales bacterium]MDE1928973.1 putative DNA-binding domain-containing protein [Burkholderiales bacterium]